METVNIFLIAVVITFLSIALRSYKTEYSLAVQISGVILLLFLIINESTEITSKLQSVVGGIGLELHFVKILLKVLVLSVTTDLVAAFCRDSNNESLSKAVELFGKSAIIILSLPLLSSLLESVVNLLE